MMSTTPKSGRLLLAAACGMFLASPTDAQESTAGWTARLKEQRLEVLRHERRILLAAYNEDLNRATAEVDRASNTVAPAPSVVESAPSVETAPTAEVAAPVAEPRPFVVAPEPVQVAEARPRRNAGRSSMRRDWQNRRRKFGYRSEEPMIEPPGAPETEPVEDAVVAPTGDAVEGSVPEAKVSGDIEPNRLPQPVAVEKPKREKRSFLSRIFGRKPKPEPVVEETSPVESDVEDAVAGPTEPPATQDEAPIVAPAPTDVAEAGETESGNEFELPEPTTDDDREPLPMPPLPEETVAEERPVDDALANPFPELSESEADAGEESPFETVEEPVTEPAPMPEENPFEVEAPEPARIAEETPAAPAPTEDETPVIRPRGVASTPAETAPPAPSDDVDPRVRRIQERADLTGLKGFCPVALRDDRQLVDAQAEFAVVHKARTYHLSSRDAMQKFESDPQKYAPVASGHDVILLTVEGRRVEGSLDHAVWYKDRLHLFATRETLTRFVTSLNRDPFGGSARPASNEVPSTEPTVREEPKDEVVEDAVIEAEPSGPTIQLPTPSADDNPFEYGEENENPFEEEGNPFE